MTLDALNTADGDVARRELERCCGSPRWASAMAGRRPFSDEDQMLRAAEECWWSLEGGDWLEAFAKHPRIGERAAGWAAGEQSGVTAASDATMRQLSDLNQRYERKFGHVFLIFATGKSADLMLAELRRRIANDPATELRTAAAEQAKITALRLHQLLSTTPESQRHP